VCRLLHDSRSALYQFFFYTRCCLAFLLYLSDIFDRLNLFKVQIRVVPVFSFLTRWYRSWLRHCATRLKVAGSIPDEVIGISIDLILQAAVWTWTRLSFKQKSVPGIFLGGGGGGFKGGRCVAAICEPNVEKM
jgi:hypothetical protein